MKKSLFGIAAAAIVGGALPAYATTFPALTTIYVGSGVKDDGETVSAGIATTVFCTNASGLTASVRVLILSAGGAAAGSHTFSVLHGRTVTASTHRIEILTDTDMFTGMISQGGVVVESTESGVFCTAAIMDAAGDPPAFSLPLNLVRVNPHPGTAE